VNMALPAIVCHYLFRGMVRSGEARMAALAGFASGFVSITLSLLLVAATLVLTQKAFLVTAKVVFAAHVPVMAIEGIVTAAVLVFLKRVKPEIIGE